MLQSFNKKKQRQLMGEARGHVLMSMAELKHAGDSVEEIQLLHTVNEMLIERLGTRTPDYCAPITTDRIASGLRALALDPDCSSELAHDALLTADLLS